MLGQKKRRKPDFIETMSAELTVIPVTDSRAGLDFLVSFFGAIRPGAGRRDTSKNLEAAISALYRNPELAANLRNAILSQLTRTDLSSALMESGIPLARGFWQEFFGRLRHKILPPLQDEHDFLYVFDRVFFRSNDYKWVEGIPRTSWVRFFESIGLSLHIDDKRITLQLLQSLKTLSFQVAQLGLEKEVLNYITPEDRGNNPFVAQHYCMHELEELLGGSEGGNGIGAMDAADEGKGRNGMADADRDRRLEALTIKIAGVMMRTHESLDHIRENQSIRGASLHQTYILILLANRLERISILVDLLCGDTSATFSRSPHIQDTGKFVDFFRMLVRNENRRNSLVEFMSHSLGYLAYQIAEHKEAKGNKYITSNWQEYRSMLYSAMGGGAWVCLLVLIKNLLTRTHMAIFWHGFAYSVNYSAGFVLIEETHTTLATKQPAFTASAVAGSLDKRKSSQRPNLYNLAVTVAKVSRSQIASFAGNLIIVFPGVWVLAWIYDKISGHKLVEGEAAVQLLKDQHPWQSMSLLYACNTGFFLFLSGIIAGYVQNKIRYSHVSQRLQIHPLLRLSMSAERLRRLGDYVEKHAGPIAGSIALGFFLGMSGIVLHVFGIPFDIRHITISAGNVSLAAYGLGWEHIRPWYLVTVILGVLGIGFLNFLVSFSLAFFVAVKSRGVHLREYPEFLGILYRYFRNYPLDFIRPRKRQSGEE